MTNCGYRCVDGYDVGCPEYGNMINAADPDCPGHGDRSQKNEAEGIFRELVRVKDEWFWMLQFYADDRHEDISHPHLRTEWEKL